MEVVPVDLCGITATSCGQESETVPQPEGQEARGGGTKPLSSVWRLFRRDNENPAQAGFAVLAAASADAFLTFWPFRFSIFILINISLGFFFFFLFSSAMKGSGSSAVGDEGLKGRGNSFLKVSIKFHLSRAEWRAGRAGLGGGQVDSAGMS